MSSKKCSGVLENKKICGAETFFNDANGEQCPKECAHCGHILNPYFDEDKEGIPTESFETKYKNLLKDYNELETKYNDLVAKTKPEGKDTKDKK